SLWRPQIIESRTPDRAVPATLRLYRRDGGPDVCDQYRPWQFLAHGHPRRQSGGGSGCGPSRAMDFVWRNSDWRSRSRCDSQLVVRRGISPDDGWCDGRGIATTRDPPSASGRSTGCGTYDHRTWDFGGGLYAANRDPIWRSDLIFHLSLHVSL